jgi:hypothetical protein
MGERYRSQSNRCLAPRRRRAPPLWNRFAGPRGHGPMTRMNWTATSSGIGKSERVAGRTLPNELSAGYGHLLGLPEERPQGCRQCDAALRQLACVRGQGWRVTAKKRYRVGALWRPGVSALARIGCWARRYEPIRPGQSRGQVPLFSWPGATVCVHSSQAQCNAFLGWGPGACA